jgi:HK97 family phage portal protein
MIWPFTRSAAPEVKEHPAGGAFMVPMAASWSRGGDKRKQYVEEGFQLNVIVYRAVMEAVRAAQSLQVELYSGGDLLEAHPALDLLRNPAPQMTWEGWIAEMIVNRMLMGEMAAVAANEAGPPVEVWPLNPLHVQVEPGAGGLPSAYIHEVNRHKRRFPVDPQTGDSQVMFSKSYNPSDYWRGQSPLMAAALAADTHNAGMRWNFSLLRNSARPSGLVRFKSAYPSGEVIQRMREYFKARMQGSENAGEIPMLAEDAEWVALSQSARDMDFLNTMKETAKYVASALGVPLPLIDNDASTFNNLEQAKERLYTDTVIPLMRELLSELNNWLLPRFGDGLELRIDMDAIPALEALRERMFNRAVTAYDKGVLTREEARELMGYQPQAEGGEYRPIPGTPDIQLPDEDAKALAYGLEVKADTFAPTDAMRRNYRRGLEKHEDGLSGDGIEPGTIRVARDIAGGESVTAAWVRKANRWWARNERFLEADEDSPAYVSALLWGGAAGRDWYRARARELDGD